MAPGPPNIPLANPLAAKTLRSRSKYTMSRERPEERVCPKIVNSINGFRPNASDRVPHKTTINEDGKNKETSEIVLSWLTVNCTSKNVFALVMFSIVSWDQHWGVTLRAAEVLDAFPKSPVMASVAMRWKAYCWKSCSEKEMVNRYKPSDTSTGKNTRYQRNRLGQQLLVELAPFCASLEPVSLHGQLATETPLSVRFSSSLKSQFIPLATCSRSSSSVSRAKVKFPPLIKQVYVTYILTRRMSRLQTRWAYRRVSTAVNRCTCVCNVHSLSARTQHFLPPDWDTATSTDGLYFSKWGKISCKVVNRLDLLLNLLFFT